LHRGHRTFEALDAIKEGELLVERFEERGGCSELHRLCGVVLNAIGRHESQIEASFREAIRIAREQKSQDKMGYNCPIGAQYTPRKPA
jgi:hypothetical protein